MLALEFGGKDYAWGSWQIISLLAVAVVVGFLFIQVERRAHEPILPLPLFKNRMVLAIVSLSMPRCRLCSRLLLIYQFFNSCVGRANSNVLVDPDDVFLNGWSCFVGFLQRFFSFRAVLLSV